VEFNHNLKKKHTKRREETVMIANLNKSDMSKQESLNSIIAALEYLTKNCSLGSAKSIFDTALYLCLLSDDVEKADICALPPLEHKDLGNAITSLEFLKVEARRCGLEDIAMILDAALRLCGAICFYELKAGFIPNVSDMN
jgi:hypothetical protein